MDHQVLVDVRAMPPRERHPKIFKAWDELPVGRALKLVNDHNPKPLYYEFSAEHPGEFKWTTLEQGPDDWSVLIERVAAPRERAAAADAPAPRPEWAKADASLVVDAREDLRAGREPFPAIMAAVAQVQPGGVFVLRATFEPQPLYKLLGSKGFEHWPERLGEDDWNVYFRKKTERAGGCGCGGHGH